MFYVSPTNVSIQRTIQPLYANTQATPYSAFLDANWDRTVDIYPGMVATKLAGENVTLMGGNQGTAASHDVFGLFDLFVAPKLGIDELKNVGLNVMPVWRGAPDGTFAILAPAFATTGITWADLTTGARQPLRVTGATHADGPGKLTPEAASGTAVLAKVAATLVTVVSATKIIVSLDNNTKLT